MTPDQTFILAILAVIVTPLINYFITSQTQKELRKEAREATATAKETLIATKATRTASDAAAIAANHTGDKFSKIQEAIEKTLAVLEKGNGQRMAIADEKVDAIGTESATPDNVERASHE